MFQNLEGMRLMFGFLNIFLKWLLYHLEIGMLGFRNNSNNLGRLWFWILTLVLFSKDLEIGMLGFRDNSYNLG